MTDDSSRLPLAVITGGAGHIGLSCARRFRDHRILISDLRPDAVNSTVSTLQAEGVNAVAMPADITRQADASALAEAANGMGGFAVLIHAAGVAPPTPPEIIYAVNLYGTINILKAFEPLVKPGVVGVCVASVAGHRTLAHRFDSLLLEPAQGPADLARIIEAEAPTAPKHRLAYATSKRGTILQVQRRAYAWGQRQGRLLSVSPGVLGDTAMGAQRQAGLDHRGNDSPLGRLGSSSEIAEVIRFVTSPAASLMTGVDLLVDGGYLATADHQFSADRREKWHALEF